MDIEEYEKIYKFEETNWWFKAKRRLILGYIKTILRKRKHPKIPDVGCGAGLNTKLLSKFGQTYGIDYSSEALKFCKSRGLKNLKKASATKLPFKDNSFDVVGCFDVLYHKAIKNDMTAIKEIYRVCKKNGYFIMTDSAMMCLWSKHDVVQHSRTRYSTRDIKEKLEKAGFKIRKLSYYFFFIFPFLYVARKLDNILSKNRNPNISVYDTNKITNYILDKLMLIEYFLLRITKLPFGSSVFCVAEKV
jgi:SAM-dependent methyltransferase